MPLCELMLQLTSFDLNPVAVLLPSSTCSFMASHDHYVFPKSSSNHPHGRDAMGWVGSGRIMVRSIHGALAVIPRDAAMRMMGRSALAPCGDRGSKSGQLFGGDVVLIAPSRIGGMARAKWPTARLRPYLVSETPAACPRRRRLRSPCAGKSQRNGRGEKQKPNVHIHPNQPRPQVVQAHGEKTCRSRARRRRGRPKPRAGDRPRNGFARCCCSVRCVCVLRFCLCAHSFPFDARGLCRAARWWRWSGVGAGAGFRGGVCG